MPLNSNNIQPFPLYEKCVHETFQQQVECTPDSVAIVSEEQQLTYRELDVRANQLAHYLRKLGVGPEVLVGICVKRSAELVVGLLGILKAGGAYLPLDPDYPEQRLSFMLSDAEVSVLVTHDSCRKIFGGYKNEIVCLDNDWNQIAQESDKRLSANVTGENAAYVIYTSGSTGKPKGVIITHSGLANYLRWGIAAYGVSEGCGALVNSSISFDLTITGLFLPLLTGKTVFPMSQAAGVAELAQALLVRDNYSLVKITPAHLRLLAELLPADRIDGRVRALVIGGEALHYEALTFWRNHDPAIRIINEYGPTETVVGCCTYEVVANDPDKGAVPIGIPIANTQLYVLDENWQSTATGATGELYVGGAGVARGYLNHPELTATKFIPNPFSRIPGARLYRTGDLGRYLPSGNLEYIGRADNQIKLRGFRIELGEIEAALAQHPNIGDCVAGVEENKRGEKVIVAYVVSANGHLPAFNELRRFLQQQLPEYMVPTTFVGLAALPLTTNGKVDRRSLPGLGSRLEWQTGQIPPRNTLEIELREIWESVLDVQPIGVTDDFFEIGGDSIAGVRLFAQMEQRLGKRLPLSVLFQASTIDQLAQLLMFDGWSPPRSLLVPIQPKGSKPPLFCLHACGAHVFIYKSLVRRLSPDQPVFGVRASGLEGQEESYTRVEDMAARYIKEIRALEPHGPYYLVGDTLGGLIALEMAHQLKAQGEDVAFLAMLDTFCPLPASFASRILSHSVHLKELGIKPYLRAAAQSARRKLARRVGENVTSVPLTTDEEAYARKHLDEGDLVRRTEWGIYLATQVNYLPPTWHYPGKITYFLARDNQYEPGEEDNRLRWEKVASEFEVHVIPGRHDTMREEPHVAFLAEKFRSCLSRAQEHRGFGAPVAPTQRQERGQSLAARGKGAP
jgi:amino acid adenylation domain-containing protein